MTRFQPTVGVECFVCGSTFTVHNHLEYEGRRRKFWQEPSSCPFCDAPIVPALRLDVGVAKSLVLIAIGDPAHTKEYPTVARFLREYSRTEAELDALLTLARELDLEAWEAFDAERGKAKPKLFRQLRREILDGDLHERLRSAAEPVRKSHRRRSERHLAVFRERQGP